MDWYINRWSCQPEKEKKTTQSEPKPQENEPSIENEKTEQERLEDEIEPVWDNKPTAEDDESEIPSSSKDSIEPVPSEFKYMNELPLFWIGHFALGSNIQNIW